MDKPEFRVERGPAATDEAFAIGMAKLLEREGRTIAAAELRRLHAERAAADGVINDLVAKVRELQEANEAFGKRQEWWNEKMLTLEAQRGALLEAYRKMKNVAAGYSNLCDGSAFTRKLEREFEAADAIARAAIKAVEGEKT